MDDILLSQFEETRAKLASLRPLYYHRIATDLGLSKHSAGTICDIINGRYDHVSQARLKEIRIRLGLTRKRPPYRRPTWAMVRELETRIAALEAQLEAQ